MASAHLWHLSTRFTPSVSNEVILPHADSHLSHIRNVWWDWLCYIKATFYLKKTSSSTSTSPCKYMSAKWANTNKPGSKHMTNSSKHAFTYREKERFEHISLRVQIKQTNQFIHLPIHQQDKNTSLIPSASVIPSLRPPMTFELNFPVYNIYSFPLELSVLKRRINRSSTPSTTV